MDGVQVGVLRDGEPVTTEAGLQEALQAVGLPVDTDACWDIDAAYGVWAITIPDDDWATLEDDGYIEWGSEDGHVFISAEMP